MLSAAGGIFYLIFQDIAPQASLKRRWFPPIGAVMSFLLGVVGTMLLIQDSGLVMRPLSNQDATVAGWLDTERRRPRGLRLDGPIESAEPEAKKAEERR